MAMRLAASGGECCPCSERPEPCSCKIVLPTECRHSGGALSVSATFLCSTRNGTAELCGYDEFTSPSSPPKRYRRKTFSGTFTSSFYPSGACSGGAAGCDQYTLSGARYYDASTCAHTAAASLSYRTDGCMNCGALGSPSVESQGESLPAPGGGITSESVARTVVARTGNGVCGFVGTGGSCQYRRATSGDLRMALSEEDTEADARARASVSSWSSWGLCAGGVLPCCESYTTARGSGFSFAWVEARLKVEYAGLIAGVSATLYVALTVRDLATDDTDDWGVASAALSPDGSGEGAAEIDIPIPPSGYAIGASSLSYELSGRPSDPETWSACTEESDGWAGQLHVAGPPETLTYRFAQHRAKWPDAVEDVMRTARFFWSRRAWGSSGEWLDFGFTDASITGAAGPTESWSNWVDVPNEEGWETRLREAVLLPP